MRTMCARVIRRCAVLLKLIFNLELYFFFSSRRRHTRYWRDWSSDVCSSDLVGGGNEFQMACDLAVMVDDAFIRHVGPEHGSVPAGGATQWLTIIVGDRRAREIVLMCGEIPARKAEEWGLVNWAVPAAELDAKVDAVVENLVRKLPQTTRYAKQHLNFWKDLAWHETINHARDWLALSMATEEPQAAVRRFVEKRES